MMERSSFFNAELKGEEYDRVYLAEDYARYFASFIGNGVFPTPSTSLQVVADGATMNLTLKQGKAWINGYFYENTDDLSLNVDVADGVLNRIDRVVVRLDFLNREIKTYIKKGAFASSPAAPKLQRDADIYELGIADIKINKGVTKLVQANITDLRHNNNYCGLVSGVVKQIDTTDLFTQFQSTFDIWFEHIKGQLSGDVAGKIQLEIDNHDSRLKTWEDFKANGGEVGGDISFKKGTIYNDRGEAIGFFISPNPGVPLVLQSESLNGVIADLVLTNNDNEICFRPTNDTGANKIGLGSPSIPFKDIYLSGVSKNANGYTKLPNGLILQWGTVTLPANTNTNAFKLPITFPTVNLNAQVTVLDRGNTSVSSACRLLNFDNASILIGNSRTVSLKATYFCIGY